MLRVGRALASAHQQGVVHRDFKPDNVVVDEHGEPYVIDFGIALDEHDSSDAQEQARAVSDSVDARASESGSHSRLTVHGNVVGTPAYMAPEQQLGNCEAAIDQYAFCVSFFELVYGQRPFAGSSTTEEVRSAMRAPVLPEERLQEIPRWLHRILLRGLSFEPDGRHASMVELCDALEAGLQSWQRRWWARGFAGLMVALAVMLGTTDGVTADMLIPEDPCPEMRHEWRGVWDEARMAKIEAALLATGLNYAAETWSLLRPRVDERVDGWLELRDEVCEETRVHGRASEADLDVRMECLKLAKIRQGALLDVFAQADEKVVEGALKAWSGLPALEACRDAVRLRDEVPWPEEPERRTRVGALRGAFHPHRALELHNRALEIDAKLSGTESPRLAPSHLALAHTHTALENHSQALHHIHTALAMQHTMAITPNHTLTPYYAQLGRIHLAMQNPHKAMAAFQRGLELYDPALLHPRRRIELDEGLAQAQSALKREALLIAQRGYIDLSQVGPMPDSPNAEML